MTKENTQGGFTNRLINETSPYLLQHAHNPVDWYPWGEEAFALAKRENKPILLSVGYSACHWCHVMAHESFENVEIANLMNEHFINIKVDREERPDVDQIYMNAVQMMTHHGGWPMTVFLTPEAIPFYAGTYFPPADRHNLPGFPRVLLSVADAYQQRPDDVTKTAESVLGELQRLGAAQQSSEPISANLLESAAKTLLKNYDAVNGGFGDAPKFPPAMSLEFLLRIHHRFGNAPALEVVQETCRKMADGGIYDQVGGGFHRYSTDAKWLVPHFEKMLYDNALLARLYLHYYQLTHDESARTVAEGILDYVVREMTDPGGGFYSTQDADSEGHEGKFFIWTPEEVRALLDEMDTRLFCAFYGITPEGNFEGKNILNITESRAAVAKTNGVSVERLDEALRRGIDRLFAARETRVKPGRDEKVLTAWNGLMLASFSEAGAILERSDYLKVARRNADFLLSNLLHDGLLLRSWKDGAAKFNGYLEDYAFLIDGLLALYESTGELRWLNSARTLADKMIEEFWDETEGGFFYTGKSHEALIVKSKDYFDNATPSGNSVAADVLLQLAVLTGNDDYRNRAVTVLKQIAELARRYPTGFGRALAALDFFLSDPKEIAIVRGSDEQTSALLREVFSRYLPNKIVAVATPDDEQSPRLIPLLQQRKALDGAATAYVCYQRVCQEPATDPKTLARQLENASLAAEK